MTIQTSAAGRRLLPAVVALTAGAAAFAVRFAFVDEVNSDYRAFLSPWYDALASGGGFRAIGQEIGNYNPPYLFLLAAATYLPIPKIAAVKLVSMIFDVVLASFVGLIVRRRFGVWMSVSAFAVVLFAPTVLINSGYWGQCDSIYAAFCLGSLYFLMRGRDWWACILFGLALSFKLQAVFFLPALLIVLAVNRRRLLALLAVPATLVATLLPAALAGRTWGSLLMVYPNQVTTGGGGGGFGGQASSASDGLGTWTQNGPTMFQWVGGSVVWLVLGPAIAALLIIGVFVLCRWRRPLTEPQIVLTVTALVLAVPFFLPQMHERYFYLADVMTIVTAYYVRRFCAVAVAASASSLLAYAPFLWRTTPVPLALAAFLEFLAVLGTLVAWVHVLTTSDSRWVRRPREARKAPGPVLPEAVSPSSGRRAARPPSQA